MIAPRGGGRRRSASRCRATGSNTSADARSFVPLLPPKKQHLPIKQRRRRQPGARDVERGADRNGSRRGIEDVD